MKKLAFIFMLFTMVLLAACQSGGTSNESKANADSGSEENGGKIEINYWYAWGDKIGENNENLAKMFNESQDKYHVNAEFQGTYDDLHAKTQAAFAAGNAPEVTLNEIASIGVFAKSGMTENLTPFVEKDDIKMDDFNPGLMGNSYVDGKLYGLPYLRSTPILYMNTTLLKEAGLDPAGPKDWKEFEEYARKLTKKGERVGISLPADIWFFEAFVAQSGGKMLSKDEKTAEFNGDAGVKALEFWKKLAKEGVSKVPTGEKAGDLAKQDFANGKAAMIFSSTADLSYQLSVSKEKGFEINTSFMPASDSYAVPTGGANLVMTAGLDKEKQEAAWEFIKFMTAKEQTIYASKYTGYLPSRLSAIDSEEMKTLYKEKPQFKVAVDQLQYGHARPMAEAYPEVVKVVVDEMNRSILKDDVQPKDALDAAAEKANQLLK
ncbi:MULTISPECIES: ABC transporter substrate-binding protein [Bacillus]|uniref:Glycerol-3-phosphate ABC transporter substrate-binding protein n=2 Tax=Bacillus TaxID=1386 RepID=A0A0M4FX93_9BACI|nr:MULTISPECIES: ABC transporter substrate-binding protein [Bacillus]ALC83530.1 glycerol-3-phosphate ABC transporter substrate-binding protein [Bacillus gobiensis]MBP1082512.1 sn-glycerol 3-phosphate transport system substrate-binding protein [Bacillus capparidis]MED1097254.1 ABC transporter substrate-binding protein [Bacillus capparidis]